MIRPRSFIAMAGLGLTAACAPLSAPDVTRLIEPTILEKTDDTAPDAAPGTCWAKVPAPGVERVTETITVQPAELDGDGKVVAPAIYRTVERPVDGSKEVWFERPCEAQVTPALIETLQRALMARNLYDGDITAELDFRTRLAIRAYQQDQGIDSGVLSMATARQLGLIDVGLDPAG